jgi:hypothetical protein
MGLRGLRGRDYYLIPFCNQLIAKFFAQTPRGLAALRKYFLHIERKAV